MQNIQFFYRFLFYSLGLLSVIFFFSSSFTAQELTFNLDWEEDSILINKKFLKVPNNFNLDFKTPKIFYTDNKIRDVKLVLKTVKYEKLSTNELEFIIRNNFVIDTVFNFTFNNSIEQGSLSLLVDFSAFVKMNNQILKVKFVEFNVLNSYKLNNQKRGYISNSVLSDVSSKWYKFRVPTSGFYKITYSQLISLGLNPKDLGFNSFHIYGNSPGKLPELNSSYVDLDLVQNSIIYEGINDGVFNENDAIVFYSDGPNKINYTKDSLFSRELNIYTDYASCFLRVTNSISPKLILDVDNNDNNYQNVINEYQVFSVHEQDDTSLVYGGQRWYGEVLDLEKKIEVSFDKFQTNISNLTFSISGATNARIYGSYVNVYADNQLIDKILLSSVSTEYIRVEKKIKLPSSVGFRTIKLELVRNSPDTKFFLDKIEINAFKSIASIDNNDLLINPRVVGKGWAKFIMPDIQNISVMDVSSPVNIYSLKSNFSNNTYFFIDSMSKLKRYVIYDFKNVKEINSPFSYVNLQNLHDIDLVDMIIVSPNAFLSQANELKLIHETEGLRSVVVTDEEIYNEFSSGEMDPTAIKQFARLVYNKQRNIPVNRLKYLLLFGDGTFDYKNRIKGNNNFLPTYQFEESEDFLSAMVSDDYFGMMDDNESLKGSDLLDIGVGRMLISNVKQAEEMISKIRRYISINENQTDWRSKIVFVADDEEGGYFINNDTEPQSKVLLENHPEINIVKLYSDAFQQVTTAGGERYPKLNNLIDNQFYSGSLVIGYVGHGGPSGAAEERILSIEQISNYKNKVNLPLFMSSTCEFTKYDDPTRLSAGEVMYLNPEGGAIALMTTTRPVFFGVNTISGSSFYKNVLQYDTVTNSSLTFGEIFRRTKNQSGTSSNRRSFTLIGDPALKISYPVNKVSIDNINDIQIDKFFDTLMALSNVKITGHIEDRKGNIINEDGNIFLTIYDKKKYSKTLGQNVDSPIIDFENQNSILFKGLASVVSGKFNIEFILPKDIDYSIGKGKISGISYLNSNNGIGFSDSFLIGGMSSVFEKDSIGPTIKMSLDSIREIENGVFSSNPILYVSLKDESGINISSSGIGHQISLVIDDNLTEAIDLNSYYVADKDTYKSGEIQFPISNLTDGRHTLKIKAWDIHNNSSEKEIQFSINNSKNVSIQKIFNYPNPFTSKTDFYIEQNNINTPVSAKLEILTISGRLVKQFYNENVLFKSTIENVFEWDGLDQFGDKLAKGVYFYRITLSSQSGTYSKLEKLVIF